jgi:hypothetical protein
LSRCKECTEEELCCEFRRDRITEDSESSARWALSKCIGAQEDRTAGSSGRRYSARWALSQCADRHRREENSLSSVIKKEESTEGSSQGY